MKVMSTHQGRYQTVYISAGPMLLPTMKSSKTLLLLHRMKSWMPLVEVSSLGYRLFPSKSAPILWCPSSKSSTRSTQVDISAVRPFPWMNTLVQQQISSLWCWGRSQIFPNSAQQSIDDPTNNQLAPLKENFSPEFVVMAYATQCCPEMIDSRSKSICAALLIKFAPTQRESTQFPSSCFLFLWKWDHKSVSDNLPAESSNPFPHLF